MSLKLNSSGGGSVTFQEPTTATNGTLSLPAGTGTVSVAGLNSNIVSFAAQSATGTSIDFTGIPSWVRRITVIFNSVSTTGTSAIQIQLGDSNGIETSSYLGIVNNVNGTTNTNFSGGFLMVTGTAAAAVLQGQMNISLFSTGSRTWSEMSMCCRSDALSFFEGCGTKTLTSALDRIRVTTVNGTDTFDAGSISILCE